MGNINKYEKNCHNVVYFNYCDSVKARFSTKYGA